MKKKTWGIVRNWVLENLTQLRQTSNVGPSANEPSVRSRIALVALSVFGLSILVLAVHIYIVTRPRPADASTRAMARIDIRQPVTQADADRITAWLYGQKGVDHVLVNPKTDIAVFTFFPIQTTADRIVSDFKANLPYKAERYIPSAAALKGGCPVASSSATYRIYSWLKHIIE